MQKATAASHQLEATAKATLPPATMRAKYKRKPPERLATILPLCRLSIVPRSEGSGWRTRVLLRCDGDLRFVG